MLHICFEFYPPQLLVITYSLNFTCDGVDRVVFVLFFAHQVELDLRASVKCI